MPFSIIPAVLGTSFLVIWVFIGVMILRDSQREARRRRESLEPPQRVKLAGSHSRRKSVRLAG